MLRKPRQKRRVKGWGVGDEGGVPGFALGKVQAFEEKSISEDTEKEEPEKWKENHEKLSPGEAKEKEALQKE